MLLAALKTPEEDEEVIQETTASLGAVKAISVEAANSKSLFL